MICVRECSKNLHIHIHNTHTFITYAIHKRLFGGVIRSSMDDTHRETETNGERQREKMSMSVCLRIHVDWLSSSFFSATVTTYTEISFSFALGVDLSVYYFGCSCLVMRVLSVVADISASNHKSTTNCC